MNNIILNGPYATGVYGNGVYGLALTGCYSDLPGIACDITDIQFIVPESDKGKNNPILTISGGIAKQVYTFHNSVTTNIHFLPNEAFFCITNSGLTAASSIVIDYIQTGDMTSYMQTDGKRWGQTSKPWNLQTDYQNVTEPSGIGPLWFVA